ncbi:MAG: hypothetical protein R3B93_18450 [Bacteroidia bacterium]
MPTQVIIIITKVLALTTTINTNLIALLNRFHQFRNITLVKYIEEAPLFTMLSLPRHYQQNRNW